MEIIIKIFLVFLFLAIYFFVLFLTILFHNHKNVFYSPVAKKKYSISFLIPVLNEQDTIKNTIEAIFKSDYPIKEIIVLNDGSKDNTGKIVKKLMIQYNKLKLLDKENSGKADSLNQGIAIAKGELIAVVDADSYPSESAVRNMVGFFNDKKVGAVTSCVFLKNKNSFFEKMQEMEYISLAWTRKLLDFLDSVYVTNGPLSIYRKSVLKEVGGFDVNSITEDIEVTWHILSRGYKTRMSLSSKVYTTVPNKIKVWWNQRVRWGVGGLDTIIKYRRFVLKKGMFGCFVIPFVALMIFLSVIGFLFGMFILSRNIISMATYVGYSASLQSTILRAENINSNPTILLIMIIILFVLSFSYSTYMFIRMNQKHILKWDNLFNRLFYMFVYLTLYPLVWFNALYKLFRKERKW